MSSELNSGWLHWLLPNSMQPYSSTMKRIDREVVFSPDPGSLRAHQAIPATVASSPPVDPCVERLLLYEHNDDDKYNTADVRQGDSNTLPLTNT